MKPETVLKRLSKTFDTVTVKNVQGYRVSVSTNAYYNLLGAIIDIQHNKGKVDRVVTKTLNRVADQLAAMDKYLGARIKKKRPVGRPLGKAK